MHVAETERTKWIIFQGKGELENKGEEGQELMQYFFPLL